jgi:hypothetical protein
MRACRFVQRAENYGAAVNILLSRLTAECFFDIIKAKKLPCGKKEVSPMGHEEETQSTSGTTTTAGYYHIYVVQETPAADGSNRIGTPQAVAILQY